ncbi:MAG: metallophosphoesterase [Gammaproteobacteria bacterium]
MTIYVTSALAAGTSSYQELLQKLQFDETTDTLWLTGNLFDGIQPDAVFENFTFLSSLKKSVVAVLGTQEIRLLSYADGIIPADASDDENTRFNKIINHEESADLLKWLRNLPIMHHDKKINTLMVHAGLPPEWSLSQASTFAIEIETALSFGNHKALFENIQGKPQRRWNAKLQGWKRLHFILVAFTQIKKCNAKGYIDFAPIPANADAQDYLPWYQYTRPGTNLVFDHTGWEVKQHGPHVSPLKKYQVLKLSDTVETLQL